MTAKIEVKRVQLLNFYSVSLSEWNIKVFIDKLYMQPQFEWIKSQNNFCAVFIQV